MSTKYLLGCSFIGLCLQCVDCLPAGRRQHAPPTRNIRLVMTIARDGALAPSTHPAQARMRAWVGVDTPCAAAAAALGASSVAVRAEPVPARESWEKAGLRPAHPAAVARLHEAPPTDGKSCRAVLCPGPGRVGTSESLQLLQGGTALPPSSFRPSWGVPTHYSTLFGNPG
eukprot:scaffold507_cov391-Prasinococcus_capsulatus_cf.AAC.8